MNKISEILEIGLFITATVLLATLLFHTSIALLVALNGGTIGLFLLGISMSMATYLLIDLIDTERGISKRITSYTVPKLA